MREKTPHVTHRFLPLLAFAVMQAASTVFSISFFVALTDGDYLRYSFALFAVGLEIAKVAILTQRDAMKLVHRLSRFLVALVVITLSVSPTAVSNKAHMRYSTAEFGIAYHQSDSLSGQVAGITEELAIPRATLADIPVQWRSSRAEAVAHLNCGREQLARLLTEKQSWIAERAFSGDTRTVASFIVSAAEVLNVTPRAVVILFAIAVGLLSEMALCYMRYVIGKEGTGTNQSETVTELTLEEVKQFIICAFPDEANSPLSAIYARMNDVQRDGSDFVRCLSYLRQKRFIQDRNGVACASIAKERALERIAARAVVPS